MEQETVVNSKSHSDNEGGEKAAPEPPQTRSGKKAKQQPPPPVRKTPKRAAAKKATPAPKAEEPAESPPNSPKSPEAEAVVNESEESSDQPQASEEVVTEGEMPAEVEVQEEEEVVMEVQEDEEEVVSEEPQKTDDGEEEEEKMETEEIEEAEEKEQEEEQETEDKDEPEEKHVSEEKEEPKEEEAMEEEDKSIDLKKEEESEEEEVEDKKKKQLSKVNKTEPSAEVKKEAKPAQVKKEEKVAVKEGKATVKEEKPVKTKKAQKEAVETKKKQKETEDNSKKKRDSDESLKRKHSESEESAKKKVKEGIVEGSSKKKKKATESTSSPPTSVAEDEQPDTEPVSEDGGDSNCGSEPLAGMVTVDEVTADDEVKEPLETEAVSDEEFPAAVDLPETEAVSEDELPPEKTDKKKESGSKSTSGSSDSATRKKRAKSSSGLVKSEAQKRKLVDGDTYDPGSPTSENSDDETPSSKRPATAGKVKSVVVVRKALSELDKYWKAVKEDPTDFAGWTYLLQYVDQENDIEAAREAYDAFLSHYPYCYGYWRKYADYEKRKGNEDKCENVFERGLKAIPLSVDLWIHYLNYIKATYPDDEQRIRNQFEKGIDACGMEFRSDRLWDSYIKWESENKKLHNVTNLFDRLLAIPTQGYTNHFESFQEHISNNPPQKVLSVDEFLTLRREVLQLLKQYEQPLTMEDGVPGEEVEVPPGMESEEQSVVKSEETTALRERIISIRRKVHKATVAMVAERWNYEEAIKRPYFHVKPLERSQLKNWKEYLDFEIEQGDQERIIVLFERCLIACALYEEFWIKFIRYLESLKEDMTDKIRNVYERACLIHHTKKPNLHLHWAAFEESHKNYNKASEILSKLEESFPNMLQIAYRRINLERRWDDYDKVCSLYEHYISISKNKVIANNMAIKYARFCWKIKADVEKAISILNKAVEKDKENPRLYLQLVDMALQKSPVNEKEIVGIIDQFLAGDSDIDQKVLFAQRKVEFLEDFGTDVLSVQKAHDEFQKFFKMAKDRKKRSPEFEKLPADGSSSKKQKTSSSTSAEALQNHTSSHTSSQSPHGGASSQQPPQPSSGATAATGPYPPPAYAQNGGYSQQPPPTAAGGYQSGQYPTTGGATQPPTPYNQQQYNQQYSQSSDPNYANYQGWGYSQTGYGGYNQTWGNYNYY